MFNQDQTFNTRAIVNYIEQINAFWGRLMDSPLKTSSIAVYLALLQKNNRLGWREKFSAHHEDMMEMLSISKNTFYECLKELVKKGYVEFELSNNRTLSGKIRIKNLYQNLGSEQGNELVSDREANRETRYDAISTLNKPLNNKHLNKKKEVEVNTRAAEIENAITDFCEGNNENSEKEKSSAQKEKELPPMAEAMSKVAGMAAWRNCVEHHGITEDDRPKLFKIFYEQKEDAYKIRYPTVNDMANNFYYWISTIKKLNKMNDLLNGDVVPIVPAYKSGAKGKGSVRDDKRASLIALREKSNEFIQKLAGGN